MGEEKQLSSSEKKAREDGWVSKEEWEEAGNDVDSWVDHREFNFRGELMERIKSQTKSIRSRDSDIEKLGKAIKELGDHNRKIAEIEYKKAIKELKQQKLRAVKEENHEAVFEIDEQIDELKDQQKEFKNSETSQQKTPTDGPPEEFVEWVQDNNWYISDIILQGAANSLVADYQQKNPESTPSEALKYMESKIKEEFPHKFGKKSKRPMNSKVTEPGASEEAETVTTKKKYTLADLSEEQRSMAKTFAAAGALKEQEYVDQLADMGELPAQQRG